MRVPLAVLLVVVPAALGLFEAVGICTGLLGAGVAARGGIPRAETDDRG